MLHDLVKRNRSYRRFRQTPIPRQTLLDLYEERIPLYEKYADFILECDRKSIRTIVEELAAGLARFPEK